MNFYLKTNKKATEGRLKGGLNMENQFYKSIKPLDLKDKRGMGVGDIYPVMLTIGLVAILIAIILFVLDEFSDQMDNDSEAQNATENIIEDIADFVPWIGIILLVIAAAIVIGILVRNLAGGSSRV